MWRVTFVTFLGRMWRSRTQKYFFWIVTFFVTSFPKNATFCPRRYKKKLRNVTIRLGLKLIFLFPSQICHLSRKPEAGRPFGLRPTLIIVETKRFVGSNVNVILTRKTCCQRSSRAVGPGLVTLKANTEGTGSWVLSGLIEVFAIRFRDPEHKISTTKNNSTEFKSS